jgi:predicted MFS family arabinose efflux permease
MGPLGERADRHPRRGDRPVPDRRDEGGHRDAPLRRRRRDHHHARPLGLRLRPPRRRIGGLGSLQTIGTIVAALLLLATFVAVELRSRAPLVPFSIFRVRTITGANVVGILVGASLFSMFYFISLYMQQVLGYSAIKAGISYLPLAVTIILAAGIASGLVTKVGFKPILAIGMACIALGLLWFTQIDVHGTFLNDILGPSLLAALGLGFAFVPVTIAAVSGIADREQGLASGLINTSQQVGGALGLAILAAVANSVIGSTETPETLVEGFQAAFAVGAGFAIVGLIATLVLVRSSDSRAHVELGKEAPAAAD